MQTQMLMPEIKAPIFENIEKTFVLEFTGKMALSQLYEFTIEVACKNLISPAQAINQRAALVFDKKGAGKTALNGQIDHFAQLGNIHEYHLYQVLLVPQVARLQKSSHTEIFLDKTIPQIIQSILQKNGISPVTFNLLSTHEKKEFVFQYNENDWDFITRWMELEGLFYYFEQQKGQERLVVTDSSSSIQRNKDIHTLYYKAYTQDSQQDPSTNLVEHFQYTAKAQPQQVTVKSYNSEQSSKQYHSTAPIDAMGTGEIMIWAENVKSNKENKRIADCYAQSYRCQKEIFTGVSNAVLLVPGTFIDHKKFKIAALNKAMLITQCIYRGSQKQSFYSLHSVTPPGTNDHFSCTYHAIDKSMTFRTPITNRIPRVSGVLPGFIDHEGDKDSVQINDKGLYKFRLAIDHESGGKGSNWVRKMESYIGDKYALSLPLRKDMEAVIAFQFGNPDLPILLGAVDNSTHRNMITSKNQHYIGWKTKHKNMLFMNEQQGKTQGIKLSTPNNKTSIVLGTDNIFESKLDAGYYLSTDNSSLEHINKDKNITIKQDAQQTVKGNLTDFVYGNSNFVCKQTATYQINQDAKTKVAGSSYNFIDKDVFNIVGSRYITKAEDSHETYISGSHIISVYGDSRQDYAGLTIQNFDGMHISKTLGLNVDSTLGGALNFHGPFNVKVLTGWNYEEDTVFSAKVSPVMLFEAAAEISLSVGASSILITPEAIFINAPVINSTSAAATNVNSSGFVNATGASGVNLAGIAGGVNIVGSQVRSSPFVMLGAGPGAAPALEQATASTAAGLGGGLAASASSLATTYGVYAATGIAIGSAALNIIKEASLDPEPPAEIKPPPEVPPATNNDSTEHS